MMIRVCECRQKETKQKWRSMATESPSSQTASRELQETEDLGHVKTCNFKQSQGGNADGYEVVAAAADSGKYRMRRFDKAEVPYCAPGEPEYIVSSAEKMAKAGHVNVQVDGSKSDVPEDREAATISLHSHISGNKMTAHEEINGKEYAEYNLDNNWKLQKRKMSHHDHNESEDWCDTDNETTPETKKASIGLSFVKKANNFTFPNYSAFRSLKPDPDPAEQEIIEEDIQRLRKNAFRNISGHQQQAGYVTSIADDGREIFIPAAHTFKKSGENCSSGYGSCSGSTIMQTDHKSSDVTLNTISFKAGSSDTKRLHKTISVGTTSLTEDKILEVLPAVGDNEYTSNYLLRDLLKAKEDAKVEKLMMNYEERIRNEHLPKNNYHAKEYYPSIKNTKKLPDSVLRHNTDDSQLSKVSNEKDHYINQEINSDNKKQLNDRLSPLNAGSVYRIQKDTRGVKNAGNSHYQQWNVRSSLKRSKARASLKKAFAEKTFRGLKTLSVYQEARGTKGKEVEQKYSSRHDNHMTTMTEINGDTSATAYKDNTKSATFSADLEYSMKTHPASGNSLRDQPDAKLVLLKDENSVVLNQASGSTERTQHSAKSRPAPNPPAGLYTSNVTHVRRVSRSQPPTTDTDSSQGPGDQSFTSVEPPSTESDHMNTESLQSHAMSIDKIESDMNDIINSNTSLAHSNSYLPHGIKIIDSGFDSASISSNESCLCAAAALQIPEESSSLYPSDILSQGRCSCACSSCLGSIQGAKKKSSWQDSPDSESWNNSNSFSSYDTNMHRRKLPSKGHNRNSTECILAPDEKYPSPNHMGRPSSVSALHSVIDDPQERRHPHLPQAQEQLSSSASDSSTAISRRYRELIKRGVPLRVSIISGEDVSVNNTQDELVHRDKLKSHTHPDTSNNRESTSRLQVGVKGDIHVDNQVYTESMNKLNLHSCRENAKDTTVQFKGENNHVDNCYYRLSPIPSLEEIIKEIPDETGCFPEETKAFLNRPDSELSVKALQAVLSGDCYSAEDNHSQCPELAIDQFFSQHTYPRQLTHGQSFDKSTAKELTLHATNESVARGYHGLIAGMDSRHVMYCQTIASNGSLVSINDLLPASSVTFHTMKSKLQKHGRIGVIGNQVLDVMGMCWLEETPPTTAVIMTQLTDPVTETEL
ncbi:unnamed protein product [Candidula unifasciata]|uniref:Uncharacterized protein n=1 Tax=Candidula unifasciata TaxID=100452 RepID=A0A8S3ZZW7_9EUPU|nr:unnamed protein product [Candidula unifasciata]